jgi:hypothetical protein
MPRVTILPIWTGFLELDSFISYTTDVMFYPQWLGRQDLATQSGMCNKLVRFLFRREMSNVAHHGPVVGF